MYVDHVCHCNIKCTKESCYTDVWQHFFAFESFLWTTGLTHNTMILYCLILRNYLWFNSDTHTISVWNMCSVPHCKYFQYVSYKYEYTSSNLVTIRNNSRQKSILKFLSEFSYISNSLLTYTWYDWLFGYLKYHLLSTTNALLIKVQTFSWEV